MNVATATRPNKYNYQRKVSPSEVVYVFKIIEQLPSLSVSLNSDRVQTMQFSDFNSLLEKVRGYAKLAIDNPPRKEIIDYAVKIIDTLSSGNINLKRVKTFPLGDEGGISFEFVRNKKLFLIELYNDNELVLLIKTPNSKSVAEDYNQIEVLINALIPHLNANEGLYL